MNCCQPSSVGWCEYYFPHACLKVCGNFVPHMVFMKLYLKHAAYINLLMLCDNHAIMQCGKWHQVKWAFAHHCFRSTHVPCQWHQVTKRETYDEKHARKSYVIHTYSQNTKNRKRTIQTISSSNLCDSAWILVLGMYRLLDWDLQMVRYRTPRSASTPQSLGVHSVETQSNYTQMIMLPSRKQINSSLSSKPHKGGWGSK